jgi:nucleoside-diphosphate-sugar epimerase
MSKGLVFLTGATGFIGYKALIFSLEHGYSVRAAVRSEEKKQIVLNSKLVRALNPGPDLTFVIVKDLAAVDAYAEAVKGVDYIVHIASSMVFNGLVHKPEDRKSYFVDSAVAGVRSILDAANKEPSVKRVVITSSTSAQLAIEAFASNTTNVNDESTRTPFVDEPYDNDFYAYNAGKVASLAVADNYVAEHKSTFDIISITPAYVGGRADLITDIEGMTGTNLAFLSANLGTKNPHPNPSITVHVDDVALMHVLALDTEKIPGNRLYLAVSGSVDGTQWNDSIAIAAERYPKAIAAGAFPNDGEQPTVVCPYNTSETRKIFGIDFKPFSEIMTSILDQYVELKGLPIA